MAAKIRSVDFLPEIFQTSVNSQFLTATLDQLIQEPKYKTTSFMIKIDISQKKILKKAFETYIVFFLRIGTTMSLGSYNLYPVLI